MTNTDLLNEKIEISGVKKKFIAEKLGISTQGLYLKIKNVNLFNSKEIQILCELLNINSLEEKESIFFTQEVDK